MRHVSNDDLQPPQPRTPALIDWCSYERAEGITAPCSGRQLVLDRLDAYHDGLLQHTQPLPVIRTMATSQPQPVRRPPWWRRVLLHWCAGGALGVVVALVWALSYTLAGGR